ncbi:hypothetical protein OG394_15805 [Kribbella sp. NBC_01245]|uniref:hypothetical protein n=1 Tax=Kribbella sp. NBC_01245 TaxID=2903578 RepID=UPI002E2A17DE|nr:hypothetical protein [Kribbella sp. NBC_01245]
MDTHQAVLKELRRQRRIDPDTVVIRRTVSKHERQLIAVECDGYLQKAAQRCVPMRGLFSFNTVDTWRAEGSYVGVADASRDRSTVWSNYGGFTAGELIVFAGWVADGNAAEVALFDRDDRQMRERVESGVAIFAWSREQFGPAVRAELIDESGNTLRGDMLDAAIG